MSPFVGPLIPLFWTSGDVSSGFQSQSGFCLIQAWQRHTCYVTHSLSFISGATPVNLLAASMGAEPSLPHTCKALMGLETKSYHAAAQSVRSGRPDALLTELSRLGFVWYQYKLVNNVQYIVCQLALVSKYQLIPIQVRKQCAIHCLPTCIGIKMAQLARS